MQSKNSIKQAFKDIHANRNCNRKITVDDICKQASVSRKTFYSAFSSKDEILEEIFADDTVTPVIELCRLLPVKDKMHAPFLSISVLLNSVCKNRDFYRNLLKRPNEYQVEHIFIKTLNKLNLIILDYTDMEPSDRKYSAYYYAASLSKVLIMWLKDDTSISPELLTQYCGKWMGLGQGQDYWEYALREEWVEHPFPSNQIRKT